MKNKSTVMLSLAGTADTSIPVVSSEVEGSVINTVVKAQNKSNEIKEIPKVQAESIPCMHDKSQQVISRNVLPMAVSDSSTACSRSSSSDKIVVTKSETSGFARRVRPPVTTRRSSPAPMAKSPRILDELELRQLQALNSFCVNLQPLKMAEGNDRQNPLRETASIASAGRAHISVEPKRHHVVETCNAQLEQKQSAVTSKRQLIKAEAVRQQMELTAIQRLAEIDEQSTLLAQRLAELRLQLSSIIVTPPVLADEVLSVAMYPCRSGIKCLATSSCI